MDGETFPSLEQNPDRSFDALLMSEHLLAQPHVEDLDCPMIFPHPPCLPPPAIPMAAHQSGSLSPRALAQSAMSEIYPEYEMYPESMKEYKEYHPTYQELDLSHSHSFSQSRDILTSALVLNEIPDMGLDYLMAHRTIDHERFDWQIGRTPRFSSSFLLLRSDYEEREVRSQYYQSYDEMTDPSYNNYTNYLYSLQQHQDMNNNHSKPTFSSLPR